LSQSWSIDVDRITPEIVRQAKGQGVAAITAYDYPTARLLDEAGVEILLVGDSLGMVVLGLPDTTGVVLDDILHHVRAVSRGASRSLVVADLPINTYRTAADAVTNARKLADAGAHAVKLEGGQSESAQIRAITDSGVAVMGHIGMLPQHIREEGGYHLKGKTEAEKQFLIDEAKAVVRAGAFAVVLELVRPKVAGDITRTITIPTIGIGSGSECDGQILVFHDLVGYSPWFIPKHVQPQAQVGAEIIRAAKAFIAGVKGKKPEAGSRKQEA
jgi:3-methyl-2-oxobutanoate hydroxymethyltransferase